MYQGLVTRDPLYSEARESKSKTERHGAAANVVIRFHFWGVTYGVKGTDNTQRARDESAPQGRGQRRAGQVTSNNETGRVTAGWCLRRQRVVGRRSRPWL